MSFFFLTFLALNYFRREIVTNIKNFYAAIYNRDTLFEKFYLTYVIK